MCEYSLRSHSITSNWGEKNAIMAYISCENLFLDVIWYGHIDTSKDWNCIDKILPYPIGKANGTGDEVTHSGWVVEADEQTAVGLQTGSYGV